MDPTAPLQLPVMPTDPSAASWPPRAPDKTPGALAGGYSRTPGAALFTPGGIPTAPPVAAVQSPAPQAQPVVAQPARPVTPTPLPVTPGASPTRAANPFLDANGKIPAIAGPEAIAAFRSRVAADPAMAAPADPQAGQIRFVDQNSPRTPAPTIVRGGVASASPGGLSNHDVDSLMTALPPHMTAAERASHGQLDIYEAQHQAALELAHATAAGDHTAMQAAQAKVDFTDPAKNHALALHLQNLRSISNTGFGTINAEQQATGQ